MAKRIRKPPSVSEDKTFRARESFDADLESMLKLVGSRTIDVPSIAAGTLYAFTVTVTGARKDFGQTVQLGLPSLVNQNLIPWGYVSNDDEVTIVLRNPSAGSIDPPSADYHVRVMP